MFVDLVETFFPQEMETFESNCILKTKFNFQV